ncbi:MAG: hypothetical protein GXO85_12160 [Chlorobi bacterium]|nr:hypothetical protein [Chlorobiota bacterium]
MKIIHFTLLTTLASFTFINAQLSLEVGNGIQVETTGGVYISGASNVIETGTGYLKGVVESSPLSGSTSFAGLTFTNGFTGTIKRTTGSMYAKGNGEGQNFKRYYEFNNTSAGVLTADITVSTVTAGTNDETGGNGGPYFAYLYQTGWQGYGDGSIGSSITAASVNIPTGASDLVFSEGTGITSKIYLEGPYNAANSNMNTTINANIPLTSPYSEDTRTVSAIPTNAVDWVLVQVRETASGTAIESRSVFIKSDGNLIADDGTNGVGIKSKPGDYFVVIKHRNHLGVMTSAIQTGLTWAVAPTNYDFTTGNTQFYGGSAGALEVTAGVWGMIAGDANSDGVVDAVDKNDFWRIENGTPYSYSKYSDFNLDANLDAVDKNDFWRINNGKSSQLP